MRLGLRMGLNSRQGGGSALDPDARLYIAAVETALGTPIATALPSATANPKRIISDFIKTEKAASRWSLHKRIYLPIYNNAAASAIDMVSRLSGTFTGLGSVTHAAGYVQGNGTSGYFDSNIGLPAVGGSNASASMWSIIPLRATGLLAADGQANPAIADRASLGFTTANFPFYLLPSTVSSTTGSSTLTSAGIIMGSTTGTSSRFVKFRSSGAYNTTTNTTLDTNALTTAKLYFMARNVDNSSAISHHTERRGGYGFGLGLTEAQAEGYSANLETLYESLTGITLP